MITFGLVGFLMERLSIPKAPMVLGIILGPLMEVNLRRAQLNPGSF